MGEIVTIEHYDASYLIRDPGGRIGSKLVNGEPYERNLLVDVYQQGRTGSALDIGAHVGNHSLWLAAICGLKVHAFEPNPTSRAQLVENARINPSADITVHPWAAGDETTTGTIDRAMVVTVGDGPIEVRRIDDVLDLDDVGVIKVDVEGMEAAALRGALDHIGRSLPDIYTEAHTPESHDEVAAVLEPLGYEMTRGIHMGSTMERWQHPRAQR